MTTQNSDYTRHSPDRLLSVFSGGKLTFWMTLAIAVHAVFIVVTSVGYIRDKWIDPEGAVVRKAAAEAAQKAEAAKNAPKAAPAVASSTGKVAVAAASAAPSATNAAATVKVAGENIPADRTNAPVVKRIAETAKPEEIPSKPNELGISLEETNPR